MTEKTEDVKTELAQNYLALGRLLGIMGICLPFVLWFGSIPFGCSEIQPSISEYYHTRMRNVFVGVLFAMGFFLFNYSDGDIKKSKDIALRFIAGSSAILTAVFPTAINLNAKKILETKSTLADIKNCCNIDYIYDVKTIEALGYEWHLIFAAIFFLTMAGFSFFLFPDKNESDFRNRVYKWSGSAMAFFIILLFIYFLFGKENEALNKLKPIYWLETLTLIAFGIAWLTKGEARRGLIESRIGQKIKKMIG